MTYGGRIEAQMTIPSGVSFTATNSGGGPTTITITAGTYYITALVAHVVAQLNSLRTPATWSGSLSMGTSGTGKVTLNYTGTGTYSIAWTGNGATLEAILGFTADLTGVTQGVASTGANQARGLFLPDCPFSLSGVGDPKRAPMGDDRRATIAPDGGSFSLVGTTFYQHIGAYYSHVPRAKVWAAEATITNSAWETFYKETQLGISSSWFTPGSKCAIYYSESGTDTLVGNDLPVTGWKMPGATPLHKLKLSAPPWVGYARIDLGDLITNA